MTEDWREIGAGVYVRRHRSYDLNVGLVVGADRCLVIDTRGSHRQARDLIVAVRRITPHPWTVVNSHGHWDHAFGNSVFRPAPIWGHVRCVDMIRLHGEAMRASVLAGAREQGRDDVVAELAEVELDAPDRTVGDSATLDIGGRRVELRYFGRGHTDNDLVVSVPDAGVVFAGDLIEEGAPPAFDDAFPLDWAPTLAAMLAGTDGPVVVPGHGDVVDRGYVVGQAAEIDRAAQVARQAHAEHRDVEGAWADTPFPEQYARGALRRALRQLIGAPAYDPADLQL